MLRREHHRGLDPSDLSIEEADGGLTVRVCCPLDYEHAAGLQRRVTGLLEERRPSALRLDLERVEAVDTTGLALMDEWRALGDDLGVSVETVHVPPAAEAFLSMAHERHAEREGAAPEPSGPIERLGGAIVHALGEIRSFTTFLGDFLLALVLVLPRPRRWRLREVMRQVEKGGANAILLVTGLTFLTGIIMAFQASTTVTKLAPPIYVADTVTVFTTKRMAPLLTAIIVASRSGTGFASELGTMRVTNQIDALTVMGFDVMQFLVLPRVIALTIAAPMLVMIGDAAGIVGGSLVGNWLLDVPFVAYFAEVQARFQAVSIYSGLIKGAAFGAIVGIIGCYRGLGAGHAAESVGEQTTTAVVNAILVIILLDAMFSAIFSLHGW